MKTRKTGLRLGCLAFCLSLITVNALADQASIKQQALEIAQKYVLVDTHIDVPYRVEAGWVDVSKATEDGDFDYPRAKKGGLNLPFMSIYTPADMEKEDGERKKYEFTKKVLDNDLYPHCKTSVQKIYFMGLMANKLLSTSFGWRKTDDRDAYYNKRLDLTGTLLNNLFRMVGQLLPNRSNYQASFS